MFPIFVLPAISAYLLLALVGLVDKILLKAALGSSRAYAFYVGVISIWVLAFLPFGVVSIPDLAVLSTAILCGAVNVYALWAFYAALKGNEVSRVITSTGALIPLFALVFSFLFLYERLTPMQLLAFAFLVLGGVLMSHKGEIKKICSFDLFRRTAWAAFLFAASFTLLRSVYLATPFLNGLFWSRIGNVVGALSVIAVPANYRRVFQATKKAPRKSSLPFLLNQLMAGGGSILQSYAISLGSVAMVGALQGVQYAFLVVLAIILSRRFPQLKEDLSRSIVIQKASALIIIGAGLYLLAI